MKYYILFATSAVMTALAPTAYAADPILTPSVSAPVPPVTVVSAPAFNWGGGYIGGQVGHSWLSGKFSTNSDTTARGKRFLGGVYTGYNYNFNDNLILGAEADISRGMGGKNSRNSDAPTFLSTKLGWNGALRARMGYAVDRFMPYVAGGLAFGDINDSIKTGGKTFSTSKIRTGWTVGGGVDYAATDNLILRMEYRYTDFGKQNINFDGAPSFSRKLSSNDVRIGVAYKF